MHLMASAGEVVFMECWERQPGESAQAFQAAWTYFELGAERSIEQVARKLGKSRSLLTRWSARWCWPARAGAYDRHLTRLALEAQSRVIADETEEWAKRQRELRTQEWEASRALLDRAREMLSFPLTVVVENDGKTIIQPARWTFKDVAALLDLASKLGRRAADMDEPGGQVNRVVERELASAIDRLEQRLPREVFLRVLEVMADEPNEQAV